jgi:ribA/ribD-fused uncharacterized protein
MKRAKIDKFVGAYGFLSNFFQASMEFEGKTYSTSEHAYQAAKVVDPVWAEQVRLQRTPAQAKRLARSLPMRLDWDEVKVRVMYEVLKQKFKNPKLKQMLLNTGDAELVEENSHGDKVWGTVNGEGLNLLGSLLEIVRDELKIT